METKPLAICAVFENEARYLPEWLAYHRLIGVEHFVLYDTGSKDDPARAIQNSRLAQHVTLIAWPQLPARTAAYRHFIDKFALGFEWVAFLDVDEFLLPLDGSSVLETLGRLSQAAAVLVHRRVFGPGGRQEHAPGLVIETYDRRAPDTYLGNRHVRPIVRGSQLLDVGKNPHEFEVAGAVLNTAAQAVPNSAIQARPCYERLVINHYYTKSRQDWLAKLQRNMASADPAAMTDEAGLFEHLADICNVKDAAIQPFAAAVVEALRPDQGAPEPATAEGAPPVPPPVARAGARVTVPLPKPAEVAPGWVAAGPDAQERTGGLGLVFRDRSRVGEPWIAALRGGAVAAIDPAFLLDEYERLRDFPSDAEARAACDEALAQEAGH